MKVVLFSPLPPPSGGMATWTTTYLKNTINEVFLINTAFVGKSVNNRKKIHIRSEFKRTLGMIVNTLKIPKAYKIIHFNCSCDKVGVFRDLFLFILLKIKNKKIILHCHCDIPTMIKKSLILNMMIKLSECVITLTDDSTEYALKNNNKVKYIPNFLDIEDLKNTKIKIRKKIKKVVFVGHVIRTKGINEYIKLAHNHKDINFYVVGDNLLKLENEVNIFFLGNLKRNEVISIMKKCDLLVHPSYTEGFPCVLLEAMSVGLPIIASKVGAIPKILDNSVDVLFDSNNYMDLEKKFVEMFDFESRKIVSNENYKNAYKYSAPKILKQYNDVYIEVLNDNV